MEKLINLAVEHAIKSVKKGWPLTPFAFIEKWWKSNLMRFAPEDYSRMDLCLQKAYKYLANIKPIPDSITFAFEGLINDWNEKVDAIMVKVFNQWDSDCLVFAQKYKYNPKAFFKKFTLIWDIEQFEKESNTLFKPVVRSSKNGIDVYETDKGSHGDNWWAFFGFEKLSKNQMLLIEKITKLLKGKDRKKQVAEKYFIQKDDMWTVDMILISWKNGMISDFPSLKSKEVLPFSNKKIIEWSLQNIQKPKSYDYEKRHFD